LNSLDRDKNRSQASYLTSAAKIRDVDNVIEPVLGIFALRESAMDPSIRYIFAQYFSDVFYQCKYYEILKNIYLYTLISVNYY